MGREPLPWTFQAEGARRSVVATRAPKEWLVVHFTVVGAVQPDPRIGTVIRSVEDGGTRLLRLEETVPPRRWTARSVRRKDDELALNELSPGEPTPLERAFLEQVSARPAGEVLDQVRTFVQERVDRARAHVAHREAQAQQHPINSVSATTIQSGHLALRLEELRRAALSLDDPSARLFAIRAADAFVGDPDDLIALAGDIASSP